VVGKEMKEDKGKREVKGRGGRMKRKNRGREEEDE
jgi:hypothetical protein